MATAGRDAAFVSGKALPTLESIITAPSVNPSAGRLVSVTANSVSIDGFVLDGNNAAIIDQTGADLINGVGPYIDAHNGIDTYNGSGKLPTPSTT